MPKAAKNCAAITSVPKEVLTFCSVVTFILRALNKNLQKIAVCSNPSIKLEIRHIVSSSIDNVANNIGTKLQNNTVKLGANNVNRCNDS